MAKPLGAGSEIDAWCTKCRMDLGHRIVAMLDGRPKRVECQTCGSQHNYRPAKTGKGTPASRTRPPAASGGTGGGSAHRAKVEASRRADWEAHVLGQAATAFSRFSIERTYAVGELVLHRKFGEGYVVELLEGKKVSIMFGDGLRTLVHGQK
ncbi:MAG: hypothetical protein JW751_22410 [Polyangiaceae bacterium]|nr:hypothetical protein [Polyangiaceae bacterium]